MYFHYSRPTSWTEWAEIFCGHSWMPGGGACFRLKQNPKLKKIFQNFFLSTGNAGSCSLYIIK